MACRRCLVSGHVQGVYFRASTRSLALSLGVTGYARNLRDGRVEVLACGSDEAVATLCAWLSDGPPGARVSEVRCESYAAASPATFQIV